MSLEVESAECVSRNLSSSKHYLPFRRYVWIIEDSNIKSNDLNSMMSTVSIPRDDLITDHGTVSVVLLFAQKGRRNLRTQQISHVFQEFVLGYFIPDKHKDNNILASRLLDSPDHATPPIPLFIPSLAGLHSDVEDTEVPMKRISELIMLYIDRFVHPSKYHDPKSSKWWPAHDISTHEDQVAQMYFLFLIGRFGSAEWIRVVRAGYANIYNYHASKGSVISVIPSLDKIDECITRAESKKETLRTPDLPLYITTSLSYFRDKLAADADLAQAVSNMIISE
jgi:hypothetical protein